MSQKWILRWVILLLWLWPCSIQRRVNVSVCYFHLDKVCFNHIQSILDLVERLLSALKIVIVFSCFLSYDFTKLSVYLLIIVSRVRFPKNESLAKFWSEPLRNLLINLLLILIRIEVRAISSDSVLLAWTTPFVENIRNVKQIFGLLKWPIVRFMNPEFAFALIPALA